MKTDCKKPIFFKQNRVRRIYTGGKLFSQFFGDNSEDGFFPEEWVCSTTKALNEGSTDEKEGVSITENGEYFDDLLEFNRYEMIGERKEFGVLVKILDSAIRLPVQAHPDKEFSKIYFNSNHGKAESWVILETRENACIYFGFKEKISTEEFENALNSGEEALTPLLNRIPVKPGDVFYIPAKAVHAIGAGCLLLETQEPTDFTIQPEKTCGDYVLSDNEKYIGLKKEDAFKCFDMDLVGDKAINLSRKIPKLNNNKESLITQNDTPWFSVNRYKLCNEKSEKLIGPAVYVATSGNGKIEGKDFIRNIKKGDYFFIPFAASSEYNLVSDKNLDVVQCLPPKE